MELRRRQNASLSDSGDSKDQVRSSSPESSGAKIDRNFTRCIVLVFFVMISAIFVPFFFASNLPVAVQISMAQVLDFLGLEPRAHAVVLDAGSTGSRVLAFTYKRDIFNGNRLKLVDELWKQVKPGLSSFAKEPVKAGKSVQELIDAAKDRIPQSYWSKTPITLKATAGLRLLPKDESEAIIQEVTKVLQSSGFEANHPSEKLIEIMNPMEEGLYAWFTVNYLLGSFESGQQLWNSAASLDLGGGSTQITFAPKKIPVSGLDGRKHFLHEVNILSDQPWKVYSHSYLGLGLMAAREAIFVQEGSVKSSCIHSKSPITFAFHGKNYEISAKEKISFDTCLQVVQAVIKSNDVHMPEELKGRKIVAFSYFYDLAIDAGLISGLQGTTKISAYKLAAQNACQSEIGDKFSCLDLTFLYGLLSQGYGLPDSKEISLYKKINGHEASWALGVGYHMIN